MDLNSKQLLDYLDSQAQPARTEGTLENFPTKTLTSNINSEKLMQATPQPPITHDPSDKTIHELKQLLSRPTTATETPFKTNPNLQQKPQRIMTAQRNQAFGNKKQSVACKENFNSNLRITPTNIRSQTDCQENSHKKNKVRAQVIKRSEIEYYSSL